MAALDEVGRDLVFSNPEFDPISDQIKELVKLDAKRIAWMLFDQFKSQMKIKKFIFTFDFSDEVEAFVTKLAGARPA